MNKIILLLFLVVSISSLSQETNYIDNDTVLSWDMTRKLKWVDFKGVKDTTNYSRHGAVTNYSLYLFPKKIYPKDYEKINVIPLMYKNTSWSVDESVGLLLHEQLHFDIAELYARKIRKCFEELKKGGENNIYTYIKIANELDFQCTEYQKLYDSETRHGQIGLRQLAWQRKIARELNELMNYSYKAKLKDIQN
ncbi:hypothetical protein DFQ05_2223 [Winogradskyella wandonensis]|uniref:Secreted Zn-dependent protease n=1 Tax=Winogradskyella wandonensis TaxID=1442586 RepID=A0A4V2PT36_9FLAO|nr:hypothetical protein [Winogradskyella wandonensis]TCK65011.1 hypothetical protein DFQ05_2223 [Winogradskyella wandonensis]